jgi:hypothetical protein
MPLQEKQNVEGSLYLLKRRSVRARQAAMATCAVPQALSALPAQNPRFQILVLNKLSTGALH